MKNDGKVMVFLCLKSAVLMVDGSLFPVLPQIYAYSPIPIVGTVNERLMITTKVCVLCSL